MTARPPGVLPPAGTSVFSFINDTALTTPTSVALLGAGAVKKKKSKRVFADVPSRGEPPPPAEPSQEEDNRLADRQLADGSNKVTESDDVPLLVSVATDSPRPDRSAQEYQQCSDGGDSDDSSQLRHNSHHAELPSSGTRSATTAAAGQKGATAACQSQDETQYPHDDDEDYEGGKVAEAATVNHHPLQTPSRLQASTGGLRDYTPHEEDGLRLGWEAANRLKRRLTQCFDEQAHLLLGDNMSLEDHIRDKIRSLETQLDSCVQEQEDKIQQEQFEEAAELDEKLKILQTAITALKSTSHVETLGSLEKEVFDLTQSEMSALQTCMEEFQHAQTVLLHDACTKVAFEEEKTANDVERLQFEADRLVLDESQIFQQLSVVEQELVQVHSKLDAMTEKEKLQKESAEAQKRVVKGEIESIKRTLAEKVAQYDTLEATIQKCNMHLVEARNKFTKQLFRLETSQKQLKAAQADVVAELQQLQQFKANLLASREKASAAVRPLIREASYLHFGTQWLARKGLVPLRFLQQRRETFTNTLSILSEKLHASAKELNKLQTELEKTRKELTAIQDEEEALHRETQEAIREEKVLQEQRQAAVAARNFREAAKLTESMRATVSLLAGVQSRLEELTALRGELTQRSADLSDKVQETDSKTCQVRTEASGQVKEVSLAYAKDLLNFVDELKLWFASQQRLASKFWTYGDVVVAAQQRLWENDINELTESNSEGGGPSTAGCVPSSASSQGINDTLGDDGNATVEITAEEDRRPTDETNAPEESAISSHNAGQRTAEVDNCDAGIQGVAAAADLSSFFKDSITCSSVDDILGSIEDRVILPAKREIMFVKTAFRRDEHVDASAEGELPDGGQDADHPGDSATKVDAVTTIADDTMAGTDDATATPLQMQLACLCEDISGKSIDVELLKKCATFIEATETLKLTLTELRRARAPP